MSTYDVAFKHLFSRVDPERAHEWGSRAIRLGRPVLARRNRAGAPVHTMGLTFPGALGLAAGFDKNATSIDALSAVGFGFVEIGTVTAQPQPGNPKPRLFRLVEDRAVVNRMGFNNDGAEAVARRLKRRAARGKARRSGVIVGVNIGKSKVVPEDDEAAVLADYRMSASLLAPFADYLVVNVSSPNTPGLRSLQATQRLEPLLLAVREAANQATPGKQVPLLVKIAPDLTDEAVDEVADLALSLGLEGIVATNTTISREGLASPAELVDAVGAGGLSGVPLRERACEVTSRLRRRVGPEMTIIGVGGITTVEDAVQRLAAGATLLQGYTAFIYEGPGWPREIQRGLASHVLARRG